MLSLVAVEVVWGEPGLPRKETNGWRMWWKRATSNLHLDW